MTNTTQFDEHMAYLTSPKRSKMQQQPIDDTWQLDTDGNEVDDFHDDDGNTTSNDMPTTTLSKQRKKIIVGVLVVSIIAIIVGAICIGVFMKEPNEDEKQQSNIDSIEMEGASDGSINKLPTPSPMIDSDIDASSSSSFFFANNDTSTVASDSPTLNPSQHLTESPSQNPTNHLQMHLLYNQ